MLNKCFNLKNILEIWGRTGLMGSICHIFQIAAGPVVKFLQTMKCSVWNFPTPILVYSDPDGTWQNYLSAWRRWSLAQFGWRAQLLPMLMCILGLGMARGPETPTDRASGSSHRRRHQVALPRLPASRFWGGPAEAPAGTATATCQRPANLNTH